MPCGLYTTTTCRCLLVVVDDDGLQGNRRTTETVGMKKDFDMCTGFGLLENISATLWFKFLSVVSNVHSRSTYCPTLTAESEPAIKQALPSKGFFFMIQCSSFVPRWRVYADSRLRTLLRM